MQARRSQFSPLIRCTSEESPPSFPVIPRSVKGFMNRFNAGESSFEEKRTPARWGQRAGVGVLPEGGPEEIQSRFSASPLLLVWPARKSVAILRRLKNAPQFVLRAPHGQFPFPGKFAQSQSRKVPEGMPLATG